MSIAHAKIIQIRDYTNLVDQVSRVLRPGGLFDFMEFGFQIFDINRQLIQVATSRMEAPWLPRWMALVYMAVQRRGGTSDAAGKLHGWVRDIPVFEDIVHNEYWMPASPWFPKDNPEHEKMNEFGRLLRDDFFVSFCYLELCYGVEYPFVGLLACWQTSSSWEQPSDISYRGIGTE